MYGKKVRTTDIITVVFDKQCPLKVPAMAAPNAYKWIYTPPPKLPKFALTSDAEYVVNLVNVNMWL